MSAAGPLFRLSKRRLASRPLRTSLSVVAIAAAVAFVLAVQVVNISPSASYRDLEDAVGGDVDLYMVARSERGVPDRLFGRIQALPQVEYAAPISQQLITISSTGHSARVALIGADERLRAFHPPAGDRELFSARDETANGIYLPRHVARQLSVGTGDSVSVRHNAEIRTALIAGVLNDRASSALSGLSVALAPLGLAQGLTGTRGRITRVLVSVRGEQSPATAAALKSAGGGLLDVQQKGSEAQLFDSATWIERQTASLFAALTLLIGALLVYNVAALNAIERRRDVAVMRMIGAGRRVILSHTIAEAAVVGLLGSVFGVILGRLLLKLIAGGGPDYVSAAFLVSPGVVVPTGLVALAIGAGTLVAIVGATIPTALQMRSRYVSADERGTHSRHSPGKGKARVRVVLAVACLLAGAAVALAAPSRVSLGIVLMIVGAGIFMPTIVRGAVRAASHALPKPGGPARLGIAELVTFPGRAVALASICAMCFGTLVLIGGSASNLEKGIALLGGNMFDAGDLWISVDGPENRIGTQGFDARQLRSVREIPGVSELRPYRLTYLDFDERRVFVIGYSPGVTRELNGNEFIGGDGRALASGLPRSGDVAVSQALARREHLKLGQTFELPTPTGIQRVRYVATISNYGWQAGAITMGGQTFTSAWGSDDASMLGVKLAPGASLAAVDARLRAELGAGSAFRVETPAQGVARGRENVKLALLRLRQIELAVLIGAILAMTASSLTAISQRRRRLAGLRAIGMSPLQTATALMVEIGFILVVGAVVGIALGLAGQRLLLSTFSDVGFPVHFAVEVGPLAAVGAALLLIALVSTALSTREALRRSIVEDLAFE